VVDVEHEGVCAFDEDGGFLLFGGGEERDLVDDVVLERGAVALGVLVLGSTGGTAAAGGE
jgi:hypothetical protein